MASDTTNNFQASAPFEGPEKLLEIWFAPSVADVLETSPSVDGKIGLRKVDRKVWEEMLDIVQCKVLSVINGTEMDAYLLSESSFFVSPHRLILKTCGTTLNLLGLPRILDIAKKDANLPTVYRCFYSRKSFMFPERQLGPHRDWKQEVEYLDNIFKNGAAYTVGKVNGDHWLLYITSPEELVSDPPVQHTGTASSVQDVHPDYTIEILMSNLSPTSQRSFFPSPEEDLSQPPSDRAQILSKKLGISDIFPSQLTTLDAYSFSPCGYSSNALIKWGHESLLNDVQRSNDARNLAVPGHFGEGYYTIHVTPEEGWSYASFECNIPLSTSHHSPQNGKIPDVKSLVQRVVNIFQPGRLTLTLFISSKDNEVESGESAVENAQKAFKAALSEPMVHSISDGDSVARSYKRTDKINYEFGGYDLAFASFELK